MLPFIQSHCLHISNGWDKKIVDPDPEKQYTQRKLVLHEQHASSSTGLLEQTEQRDVNYWPKGPYTQQIEGVLPPVLTEELIMTHLRSSGKQLKRSVNYSNVDYSTLQRGHQYFMESYIPGKHVLFCCKDDLVWVKARCYHSQKKNESMHEFLTGLCTKLLQHSVCALQEALGCVAMLWDY